jgi:hypothetical protein
MIRRFAVIVVAGVFLAGLGLGCGSDGAAPKADTNAKKMDQKQPSGGPGVAGGKSAE